jgi:hypothetical protein
MTGLFILQLSVSFIAGGGIIALLSFLVERAGKRVAGIILAIPTTVAFSFFFMGWTLSPAAVAEIVPATLIPLGLSVLYVAVYSYAAFYIARCIDSKILQITLSFAASSGIWFALAVPVTIIRVNRLAAGMAGYSALVIITHFILKGKKNHDKPVTLVYTAAQKTGRAVFAGFIVFTAVLLGRTLNPFWGGMFAVFPATFSTLLIILHFYHGQEYLVPTVQRVAVGSLSLLTYELAAMVTFPKFGFVTGTIFSYIVSLIVTLVLIWMNRDD